VLTLRTLVDEMGLELATGEAGADAPVRWVHITELPDPTPWLSGGELILTTGLQLTSPRRQSAFARLLAENHLAGLGFGTGFAHDTVPAALLEEAAEVGLPVFEVPYELPFIALTEKAFTRLVNEGYELLQRGIAIHKRMERLVLEERGLDELVRALSASIGGSVVVLDAHGATLARREFRRPLPDAAVDLVREEIRARTARGPAAAENGAGAEFAPVHPEIAGRSLAIPVSTGGHGVPQAWLLAARDAVGLGDFERLIVQQASTVVALELMRQRAMRDTERRLAGDVLAEAIGEPATGGQPSTGRELESRLQPFGVGARAAVMVFATLTPAALEGELDRFFRDAGIGALVVGRGDLLCAVVDAEAQELDPVEVAARAREALAPSAGGRPPRAAASRVAAVSGLRRSFHEARCAIEASAMANGSAPPVASYRDLGAFQLLLALQDDEALRLYCDSVLGPLEDGGGEYGDELVRSLEAFIECNGQWEKAARELFCHRHTLRYRIRRVEELTGRDLKSARDRIEFWLALRGRELIE